MAHSQIPPSSIGFTPGVSKLFENGARICIVRYVGANLGLIFYIDQQCIQANFNKPFCVSHLLFYFNLFTYILYDRGCEPDEI